MPLTHEEDQALRKRREAMRAAGHTEVTSIFTLAGLPLSNLWELANPYWPDNPNYDEVRDPWWLAQTSIGLIRIGWRKRVLSIHWDACTVRGIVTTDEVTKGDDMAHAWSTAKAVEYLVRLRELATAAAQAARPVGLDRTGREMLGASEERWPPKPGERHRCGCENTGGTLRMCKRHQPHPAGGPTGGGQ